VAAIIKDNTTTTTTTLKLPSALEKKQQIARFKTFVEKRTFIKTVLPLTDFLYNIAGEFVPPDFVIRHSSYYEDIEVVLRRLGIILNNETTAAELEAENTREHHISPHTIPLIDFYSDKTVATVIQDSFKNDFKNFYRGDMDVKHYDY
jgi:hypothetical protein